MLYENDREVNLTVGMEVKNYKKMCEILGEDTKGGDSKKYQILNWQRYFAFEKKGQRFVITEIYDEPFPTAEIQRKREGLYVQYIECLLMDMIVNSTKRSMSGKKQVIISKNKLYTLLGMTNDKYSIYYNKESVLIDIIEKMENAGKEDADEKDKFTLTTYDVEQFYKSSGSRLNKILKTALESMRSRMLIDYGRGYVIVYDDGENDAKDKNIYDDYGEAGSRDLASIEEQQIILDIQNEALRNVDCSNISDIYYKNCYKKYQKEVRLLTRRYCPEWKFFYPVFYLVHCTDLEKQLPLKAEEVRKLTAEQQRLELNAKVCKTLRQSIEGNFERTQNNYNEYMKGSPEWGEANPMHKPFKYEDDFVEKQQKLIDYTIKINDEKKG